MTRPNRTVETERLLELEAECEALREVAHWAQATLTAWNVGDLPRECLLHKKLREVMIAFRERTGQHD